MKWYTPSQGKVRYKKMKMKNGVRDEERSRNNEIIYMFLQM